MQQSRPRGSKEETREAMSVKKHAKKTGETLASLRDDGLLPWYDSYAYCDNIDAYKSLMKAHTPDYTYTFEWCQFKNDYFLVRHENRSKVSKKDPKYIDLDDPDWDSSEYTELCVAQVWDSESLDIV